MKNKLTKYTDDISLVRAKAKQLKKENPRYSDCSLEEVEGEAYIFMCFTPPNLAKKTIGVTLSDNAWGAFYMSNFGYYEATD